MMSNHRTFPMRREVLLQVLWAGMETGLYCFTQQMAQAWLAAFPGDLEVRRLLAIALSAEGKREQAFELLKTILRVDPLDVFAWEAMEVLCRGWRSEDWIYAKANLYALGEDILLEEASRLPEWALTLRMIRNSKSADVEKALQYKDLCWGKDAQVLACVEFVRLQGKIENMEVWLDQLRTLQEHWPDCVYLRFGFAEVLMQLGEDAQAVNLLHRCVVEDAAGQAARRWWGDVHPYLSLWPNRMEILNYLAIPAEIQTRLGGNLLPGGHTSADGVGSGVCEEVEAYKADVSLNKPQTDQVLIGAAQGGRLAGGEDGRYPIFVVMTTLSGLKAKYGSSGQRMILQEMQRLAATVRARSDWGACVVCVDDAESLKRFGLTPVSPTDAWKIKLLLADLDRFFAKKGERIGALLIVGGDEVLPFHRLPNPADDMDGYVISDNPYSTLDANYFIPEWPVGRMVDGVDSDAGLLLRQLQAATREHRRAIKRHANRNRLLDWLLLSYWRQKLQMWLKQRKALHLGYTASAWRRSSIAVFRSIAPGHSLLVSPPEYAGGFERGRLTMPALGYFNLHGVEDSADWYGQRDVHDPIGVDYPVALRPCDLESSNWKGQAVIFSEACYGGKVNGKKEADSIALRFLSLGARALVASTCTSYGAVHLPLVGADLLGQLFWQELQAGCAVGQAFMRAKVMLAQKLSRRQGYLDGEDQKTLLSFVLYGDPLAVTGRVGMGRIRIERAVKDLTLYSVPENREVQSKEFPALSGRTLQQVKAIVEPYLPGGGRAEMHVCERRGCLSNGAQAKGGLIAEQIVVTVTKRVAIAQRAHQVYARVTLDKNGEVTKILVSRGGCLLKDPI